MKLIFLISQPRSGSSLLQNMLSSQKNISSDVENWLLLPLLCFSEESLSDEGYSSIKSSKNITYYLSANNRKATYHKFIRMLFSKLHESSDKDIIYFLEKTPRYYHITDEIYNCFPDSKFLFLVRNPLAVLSSIINYNYNGRWYMIFSPDRIHDLFTCIDKIVSNKNPNSIFIKYENLIHNHKEEILRIMKFLLISCEDIQFNYDASSLSGKHLGFDRKSLDKHNEPVSSYENQWMLYFVTPQRKIIALHYINSLPSEYFIKFNYCKIKIIKSLNMRWYNYLFIPINFKILKYLYNSNMFFILKLIFLYDIFIFNNITRRSKIFNCIIS